MKALSSLSLAFLFAACGAAQPTATATTGTGDSALSLAVDCTGEQACPAGYECEVETEHGVTASECRSHGSEATGVPDGECPTDFEREEESGRVRCKRHGGDNSGPSASSGPGSEGDDDSGDKSDDDTDDASDDKSNDSDDLPDDSDDR